MSRELHSDYNLPLYLLTRLSFKTVRGSFLFSFIISFVLIPILNYGNYKLLGLTPELQITVVHTARRLMPIACVFPAVMLFRLFMQTDSKELLRITMCTRRLWVAFLACALCIGLGGRCFCCIQPSVRRYVCRVLQNRCSMYNAFRNCIFLNVLLRIDSDYFAVAYGL